ncbi:MAG: hypothetical protein IKO78_06225 [Bacilli bacterium]|nr:hypothetical protein [Bacilli bacterium]
MDKQMIKYLCILGALLVVMILFFLITNAGGVKLEYREMEELLVKSARNYAKDNPKILPSSLNSAAPSISDRTLTELGYMDDLSSYAKDETHCSATVEIYQTISGVYNYVPNLDCGEKYFKSVKLSTKVINDSLTTQGPGLYARYDGKFITNDNDLDRISAVDEYVFRGDGVHNYIKVQDTLWRIVAIDEDGNLLAILVDELSANTTWDNRYNLETSKYYGINDYENNGNKSRAMQTAEKVFDEKVGIIEKSYSGRIKYMITPMNLCVGKRAPSDTGNDGSIECKKVLEGQYMGLLPAYYYMSASLDENCIKTTSKSCGNYNYLASIGKTWWIATGNSENTYEAYGVSQKSLRAEVCSYTDEIKPIAKFGARSVYSSGKGTKEEPYIIRYFKKNA